MRLGFHKTGFSEKEKKKTATQLLELDLLKKSFRSMLMEAMIQWFYSGFFFFSFHKYLLEVYYMPEQVNCAFDSKEESFSLVFKGSQA